MYFDKIGTADRGEMGCRLITACNDLKIRTLTFYTKPEEKALHVRMADEAVEVSSYAAGREIIELAKLHGAQAVHPGYGVLSEDPLFAQLCIEAGLAFIGPTPHVMHVLGDKIQAREAAKKAKVPILPGTENLAYEQESTILAAARRIGFPIMVKAAGGGGGKAITDVEDEEELLASVRKTRDASEYAFGRPDLYLERRIRGAWHIEVQVICDQHGNCFHALERDCSLQRRRQKLIEESPASRIKQKLRKKLCSWAVRLVRSVGYTNVGTVEFLVSSHGRAYFIEMNPRIQVEHGVTEMRQGIDLVKLQIAIAAGEKLVAYANPQFNHVMEVRIYPERLTQGSFVAAPGRVTLRAFPKPEDFLRIDSALLVGESIEFTADSAAPLIAKVIAGGPSRRETIRRMRTALYDFQFEGHTNIEVMLSLLDWHVFQNGGHTTDSLENEAVLQERSAWAEYFIAERRLHQQNGHLAGEAVFEQE